MRTFVLIAILTALSGCSNLDAEAQEIAACMVVQDRVEMELVSPGSADFPRCGSGAVDVRKVGEGVYRVSSYVDSQNGFGAELRSYYVVTARRAGGEQWMVSIESLESR